MSRECKDEVGRLVAADGEIGRRVHPRTGRSMIYGSGRPTGKPGVFMRDPDELAAVRWVDLAIAEEALAPVGGVVNLVHDDIASSIGGAGQLR